jgi:hypothetical protein
VVQHGIFMPSAEVTLSSLKPGQEHLSKRSVYSQEAPPSKLTYVQTRLPELANTADLVGKATKTDDYHRPNSKDASWGTRSTADSLGHRSASHWRSEYGASMDSNSIHGAVVLRQTGPSYQAYNPVSCLSDPGVLTTNQEGFGKYGSKPSDLLGEFDSKMPVLGSVMKVGSTKGTLHVPGYQGFMPVNLQNPLCAKIAKGGGSRRIDKNVISDQYNSRLVGYMGHKPVSAKNDNGGVALTALTTTGSSFPWHPLHAFD